MIYTDYHVHTSFSGDSETPMEMMIQRGLELGLKRICFTEHMDHEYPPHYDINFELDTEAYLKGFREMKAKYGGQIELLFGVELGLQPHLTQWYANYIRLYPFDFIIGSTHLVNQADPYYSVFFEGRREEDAYREYFEITLDNIRAISDIDVYGHIDYIVRYGPNTNQFYSYEKYRDILDEILKKLIQKGIGIEVNTSGFKYELGHTNPHRDVLKAYHRLGGEIITIGSDGHEPKYLAYQFGQIRELLRACGYSHYTVFKGRKAEFITL